MFYAFSILLAFMLPITALAYLFGLVLITKLHLTGLAKFVGFLIAWFSTALISLLMSEERTVNSAQNEMFPAALAGMLIGVLLIAVAGKRKSNPESSPTESKEN